MIDILIPILISFFTTYLITPYAIKYFKNVGIVSTDVHKKEKPKIASSAGLPALAGIILALLTYSFIQVFFYKIFEELLFLFASLTSLLLITFSGFIDDINSAQVRKGGMIEGKKGIKRWQKPLLTLPAAFPLMAIMAGNSEMVLPFIGAVDFGILYPLLLVPIGVVGASNMINMLGGFNGLEVGLGLIYTFSLGTYALINQKILVSLIFYSTFASLLAILKYNFYPAKILAGDSLTYLLGAIVAIGAIIGNMEKAVIITMVPFLIQGFLKFYSYFKLKDFASDLGILRKNGNIESKYGNKIYSLTHLAMKFAKKEKDIVIFLYLFQIPFSILPFLNII